MTDRAAILDRGSVVYEGASAALREDRAALETWLGVADSGAARKHAR
jgi:ABC-type branched-subunit amino acid transport system ATPase component